MSVPADHYQACKDSNVPIAGNAAGNTEDLMDLRGENKSPAPLPAGFTAKGIVAMVFSVISAFLGMAVIAWYASYPSTRESIRLTLCYKVRCSAHGQKGVSGCETQGRAGEHFGRKVMNTNCIGTGILYVIHMKECFVPFEWCGESQARVSQPPPLAGLMSGIVMQSVYH